MDLFAVSTEGLKGHGWGLNSSAQRVPQDTRGVFPKPLTQTLLEARALACFCRTFPEGLVLPLKGSVLGQSLSRWVEQVGPTEVNVLAQEKWGQGGAWRRGPRGACSFSLKPKAPWGSRSPLGMSGARRAKNPISA